MTKCSTRRRQACNNSEVWFQFDRSNYYYWDRIGSDGDEINTDGWMDGWMDGWIGQVWLMLCGVPTKQRPQTSQSMVGSIPMSMHASGSYLSLLLLLCRMNGWMDRPAGWSEVGHSFMVAGNWKLTTDAQLALTLRCCRCRPCCCTSLCIIQIQYTRSCACCWIERILYHRPRTSYLLARSM